MKALLIEPNPHHFEVLPGFAHYFAMLGYDVSLLVQEHTKWGDEFCKCPELKRCLHIYTYEPEDMEDVLRDMQRRECYDILFFTSFDYSENGQPCSLRTRFENLDVGDRVMFGCYHTVEACKKNGDAAFAKQRRVASLTAVKTPDYEFLEVNPHFFCDAQYPHQRNETTSIVSIGVSLNGNELCSAANSVRAKSHKRIRLSYVSRYSASEAFVHNLRCLKHYGLELFCNEEYDRSWYSFRTVLRVPFGMRRSVTTLREAPFETMFDLVEQADFLACNIAQSLAEEFATQRTTGVKQLSLGFLKPCIIERRHAEFYGFSDKNAIVYEEGMLEDAVRRAASMTAEEYEAMRRELDELRQDVERRSLENLSEMLR